MSDPTLEFDQFLDGLTTGHSRFGEHDRGSIEQTAIRFHGIASNPEPDPGFASGLRAELMSNVIPDGPSADPKPIFQLTATFRPVRRVWVWAEVAALFLLLLPAVWFLFRQERETNPFDRSSGNHLALTESVTPRGLAAQPDNLGLDRRLKAGVHIVIHFGMAQLRTGPSFDAPSVAQLPGGTELIVLRAPDESRQSIFLWAESNNGVRGWIWIGMVSLLESHSQTAEAIATSKSQPAASATDEPLTDDAAEWLLTPTATLSPEWQRIFSDRPDVAEGGHFAGPVYLTVVRPTSVQVEPGGNGYVIDTLGAGLRVQMVGGITDVRSAANTFWLPVLLPATQTRIGWLDIADVRVDPHAAQASAPTATTIAERSAVIVLPTPTSTLESVIGEPSPTVEVRISDSFLFTEGELASTTFRTELRTDPRATATVVTTLPTGTLLYVTGFQWRSEEGGNWIPVIEAQSGAAGWVSAAWLQTPIIGGRILRQGELAETINSSTLYSLQSVTSEWLAQLDPNYPLIVILSEINAEGRDWMQVIDPATKQFGWVLSYQLRFVDFVDVSVPIDSSIATLSPTVTVTDVATPVSSPKFSVNSIVRPIQDMPLLADSSMGSIAVTAVTSGQQLLVTGPDVVSEGVRSVPVQIVPAGETGWIDSHYLESVDPGELIYPIGASVAAMVDVQLRERLPGEMRTTSVWPLPAGTTLTVVGAAEQRDGTIWLPVDDPSSEARGWIWAELLVPPGETDLPAVVTGAIVTSVDSLELRESHDRASKVISSTSGGEALRVTYLWSSPDGEIWLSVERVETGDTGWITAESVRNSIVASSFAPPPGTRLHVTNVTSMTEKIKFDDGDPVTPLDRGTVVVFEGQADIFNVLWLRVRVEATGQMGWLTTRDVAVDGAVEPSTPTAVSPASGIPNSSFPVVADLPLVLDSVVAEIGGSGASIYEAPTQASLILHTATPGATFEIRGEIIEADGHIWIQVSVPESRGIGWIDGGMPSSRPYLQPVSITTRLDVYLRSSPNPGHNEIRRLPAGSAFKPFGASVVVEGITWIPVLDQLTGQIGWLGATLGSPLDWPVGTEMTAVEELDLRSAAGLESDILTTLEDETTLTLIARPVEHGGEGWLNVRDNSGNEGWILVTDSGPPY